MTIEFQASTKKWGRSFGIIIPMDKIRKEDIKEGDKFEVIISKEKNPLKKHFGKIKFRKSTEELLREIDSEGWDE